jgi:hypothetical protein
MFSLDRKRCPHCIGGLEAISFDQAEELRAPGPVVICLRCDAPPPPDDALHPPDEWL